MPAERDEDSVVACNDGNASNVAPLSSTERSRRRRERLKAEGRARGPGKPFSPGHELSVRHGAFSRRVTVPRAAELVAELLAKPSTPEWLREESYADAVMAWGQALAEVERLRARRDELDRRDAESAVTASLTELVETTETEVRPAPGTLSRESITRQQESLSRALHRAEMRLRTMRADIGLTPMSRARLGKDIARARLDLALHWAEEDAREQASGSQD